MVTVSSAEELIYAFKTIFPWNLRATNHPCFGKTVYFFVTPQNRILLN